MPTFNALSYLSFCNSSSDLIFSSAPSSLLTLINLSISHPKLTAKFLNKSQSLEFNACFNLVTFSISDSS